MHNRRRIRRTLTRAQSRRRERVGLAATIASVETRSFAVAGMTCDHCASAIRSEISKLPGITRVDVDVAGGTVVIVGDALPADTALCAAVEEAGYQLAG